MLPFFDFPPIWKKGQTIVPWLTGKKESRRSSGTELQTGPKKA
jgi:hypothetical protein